MNLVGSALSVAVDAVDAVRAAAAEAAAALAGAPVDLALLVLSADHADEAAAAADALAEATGDAPTVGVVSVDGVIGAGRERESGPAAAVWLAALPGAVVEPFALGLVGDAIEGFPGAAEHGELFLLLADPATFPIGAVLEHVERAHAGAPIVGGFAGGGAPGLARLVHGRSVLPAGAVGARLVLPGARVLVSQGCRPIGPELVVTAAEGNAVLELAGVPALAKLEEVLGRLAASEQLLAAHGLTAGLVIDENRPEHGIGDYLVRGIVGADRGSGALLVGDLPRVGQGFRFHVRDAESADAELRALAAAAGPAASGALLFTCNGRGSRLFGTPDHDAGVLADVLGVRAAGLFCQGELGPVGGRNHVHAFTATGLVLP